MLPAIAAVTERVRIGPLVTPTSVHHPAVLANRAATIDHLSNGRMVLGLGAGWQINEHEAYGIELEPPGGACSRFEEAIQIVRSLLADDRTTFEGSVYTITDAPSTPSRCSRRCRCSVGTGSPRMLADHRPARRRVEHLGHRRRWPDGDGPTFAAACERAAATLDDAHVGAGARRHQRRGRRRTERAMDGPLGATIAGSVPADRRPDRPVRRARLRRVHRPRCSTSGRPGRPPRVARAVRHRARRPLPLTRSRVSRT